MSNIIEQSFNNLISGKVFTDFKYIPYEGQKRVILKTALIAAAAGILTGLIAGAFPAILVAGVVGLAAFSYSVTKYTPRDFFGDAIRGAVRRVSYQNDVIDDLLDEASRLANNIKARFVNDRRQERFVNTLNSVSQGCRNTARNLQAQFTQRSR